MDGHDVEVTLATVADAGEIAEVKAIGWRTTYSAWVPEPVLSRLVEHDKQTSVVATALSTPPNFAVVARGRQRLVGFALCLLAEQEEPFFDSFHVLPEARGRGVGAALLRRLAGELEQRGATTLVVTVVEGNARTRRLYERLGATHTKLAPATWAPDVVREARYRWDDLRPLREA